jgi:copper resistance protein B
MNPEDNKMKTNKLNIINVLLKYAIALSVAGFGQYALAEAIPAMQGGAPPANARDPQAYSGGYGFGPIDRPHMADEAIMSGVMINRLERTQTRDNTYFNAYEMQGWVGKDYERMVVKAEGEIELLWSHATSAYWNAQVGLRNDSGVLPGRNWLAVGMQGLAPYWFEIDAAAYVGDQGRTALRLSAEYELLFTQKLILQPRIEANFYGIEDQERELGAGLSNVVAGLRVRYEIRREFAPYLGVDWNAKFGATADYAKAAGVNTSDTNLVAGLRFWF